MASGVPRVIGFGEFFEIGRGGFGRVYRARQLEFDRYVAVKVLDHQLVDDRLVSAFESECRVLGLLSRHPNIVTVYAAAFTADGRPCIVMELYEDGSFSEVLNRAGPLPLEEVLAVGVSLAGALETAHGFGVVHGDIKPSNVFRSGYGQPALGDFGISVRTATGTPGVTHTGFTPQFAAPELVGGSVTIPDPSTDQFSLGATLCTLLAGSHLQRGSGQAIPPLQGIPPIVSELLARIMAPASNQRFVNLVAVASAINTVQDRLGYQATPIPFTEPTTHQPTTTPTSLPEDIQSATILRPTTPHPHAPTLTPNTPTPTSQPQPSASLAQAPTKQRSHRRWLVPSVVAAGLVAIAVAATILIRQNGTESLSATTTVPTTTVPTTTVPTTTVPTTTVPTTTVPTTTVPTTTVPTTTVPTTTVPTTTPQPTPEPEPTASAGPPSLPGQPDLELTDHNSFRITWAPPADDGGSPVLRYHLTVSSPDSGFRETYSRGVRSFVFDGESNTRYDVWISAENAHGTSDPTMTEEISTGIGPPDAPQQLEVELATYNTIRVAWVPPTDDGGSSIHTYHIKFWRPSPSTWENNYHVQSDITSFSFKGVTETTYVVSVWAENEQGFGPETMPKEIATSSTRPGAPQSLRLGMTDQNSFRITWEPPDSDGGSRILNYSLTVSLPGTDFRKTFVRDVSETRSFVFDGESNKTYQVAITAANKNGRSPEVTRNIGTTGNSPPGLPRNLYVGLTDNNSFRIRWDPPDYDGGLPILFYNLTIKRTGEEKTYTRSSSESRSFVYNGRSSKKYTVSIRAVNDIGASNTVSKLISTTVGPPDAPDFSIELLEDGRSFRIRWDAPADDGASPLTGYRVTVSRSGEQKSYERATSDRSFRYEGENNATYTVYVRAKNQHGESSSSSKQIKTG